MLRVSRESAVGFFLVVFKTVAAYALSPLPFIHDFGDARCSPRPRRLAILRKKRWVMYINLKRLQCSLWVKSGCPLMKRKCVCQCSIVSEPTRADHGTPSTKTGLPTFQGEMHSLLKMLLSIQLRGSRHSPMLKDSVIPGRNSTLTIE